MTKRKIIGIFLGVVLIFGLIFLVNALSKINTLPQEPEVNNNLELEYTRENSVIFKENIKNVDYLQVVNKYGDYKVRKNSEGNIEIVGREGAPLFPYSSTGLYESIQKVSCDSTIEMNAQNLGHYGLDNPQATVTVMMLDGGHTTFHIGDAAPLDDGYYIRMENSNDVYLVNSFYGERYLSDYIALYQTKISEYYNLMQFESINIIPPENSENEEVFVRTTTDAESKDVSFISGVIMEKPFFFGAESTMIQNIIDATANLEASKIVTDTLDETLQNQYGFDNATEVVIIANVDTASPALESGIQNPFYDAKANGKPLRITLKYLVGGTDGRDQFVMYNDAPVIYAVDIDVFSFITRPVYQYCQRLIQIKYLNELNSLTVEAENNVYHFTIQDPDAGDDMLIMYDEVQLEAGLFRDFYRSIIGVTHNAIGEKPEGEPVLKITYGGIDGNDIVLEFIPLAGDERKVFLAVNGEGHFITLKTKSDKILNDMHKLIRGEEILS